MAAIGEHLSDAPDQQSTDRLAGALGTLEPGDIGRGRLEQAFSEYAKTRSAASTRRAMSTWRQFCLWLIREGELDSNPLDLIDAPRRGTWQPKPLQPEDLEAIARVIGEPDDTARAAWPARDRALFALFITAGLRVGEVVKLEVGDAYLSSDPPRIRVVGKGDKPRTVTLPPETVVVVRQYASTSRIVTKGTASIPQGSGSSSEATGDRALAA